MLSDAACPQYMRTQIHPGKGINRRGCILMTHPNWLRKEKAARAQLQSDPKEPKQIYGKNFDISKCNCPCRSKDQSYHSRDPKHNSHVAAFVERLRQGETLDAALDDAIKLAQVYVAEHPNAIVADAQLDDAAQDAAQAALQHEMFVADGVSDDDELDDDAVDEIEDDDDGFDDSDFMK